jgi:ribosomal protein L11 methyltransferase
MFVWRKRASAAWLAANEVRLREIAGSRLAIVSEPRLKNVIAELASKQRQDLDKIRENFGGRIEKLSRDWLQKFLLGQKSKPLRIAKRLVVVSSARCGSKTLLIPRGAAFGTGEHATTVMSLRMLERLTRGWGARATSLPSPVRPGLSAASRNFSEQIISSASCRRMPAGSLRSPDKEFSLLDLGTGSGILALAAARFGAKRIVAIDNDPIAIATAKKNARRNRIYHVDFKVADVRRWKFPKRVDIVTANLFSELLIDILPKLKCAAWLIVSGVLREQEGNLVDALKRNGLAAVETRRRGKWVAVLAGPPIASSRRQSKRSRGGNLR